ncbi:MAG: prepilin peptidase [Gemmatimonadales bacterium]
MFADAYVFGAAAAVGAAIGSFLNVCIYRLPRDLSLVHPPSTCPSCATPIRWFDNVPVFGWLWLRGRCRSCRNRISPRYPLVEAAVGAWWAVSAWQWGPTLDALSAAVFGTLLLGIALTDAEHYIIPHEFTLGGLVMGLLLSLRGGWPSALDALLGAFVGFAVLYIVAWLGEKAFRKEAMGGGDINMMAMVGAFLGWQGALLTIFLGALVGSVIFGPIAWRTRKLVPFGVFLAVGAWVTLVAGDQLLAWYLGFLRAP